MKRLTSDEVEVLEKFLVADNDEVCGIEIHVGKDWRRGYSEPDTVEKYSLEELGGKALIKLEDDTLCALVGDSLYYKNERGYVGSTKTEYTYKGVCRATGDYLYQRAIVLYRCPITPLSADEVLALDRVLVKNNKRVVGVRIEYGSKGIGGSNTSGFCAHRSVKYTAEELDGAPLVSVGRSMICALANDVLHFKNNSDGEYRTFTLDYRERSFISLGEEIAYDTYSATRVELILEN
ncbi:MAG: hypothetical protein IJ515_00395 [Clostridia bacterium]|nr:hypothetical protein [Clostridia bacterium]